jgi:Xaa-Pro aminopeptidase
MSGSGDSSDFISEKPAPTSAADRRADVDAKQAIVAEVLREAGADALLVLEPENFAWLTGGATAPSVLDPADHPALYYMAETRWLVARNVDSQRLFDTELDGLGFQLKEWPWFWGRQQLIDYLGRKHRFASDRQIDVAPLVAKALRERRLALTSYAISRARELGHLVSHALEATCRSLGVGQTEQEIAGQLAHRLTHHGVQPVMVEVAADGRSRRYRQPGFTSAQLKQYCVLSVTARRFGLHVTASRTVVFGTPDEALVKEHDAVSKITATYAAGTVPEGNVAELLSAGRRIAKISGFEHDWRLAPSGHLTGHAPVERSFLPHADEILQLGWLVTWQSHIGAACSADTYLVTEKGPKAITGLSHQWPQKRIKLKGDNVIRPELLLR